NCFSPGGEPSALPSDHRAAAARWPLESPLLLPSHPFLPARSALFFPDWNRLFESIDHHAADFEGFAAMRRGARDHDGSLADFQNAEAVLDGDRDLRNLCINTM